MAIPSRAPSKLVLGVDCGTESLRAGLFDATGLPVSIAAVPYPMAFPKPGWAEQDPEDWWWALGAAVRQAVAQSGYTPRDIGGMAVDTTCCTVVALDGAGRALRPALVWMDARSAPQTEEILSKAKGDAGLQVNCNGEGPLSAEWMIPKALWIKENEPHVWEAAATVCEFQDFLNLRLTDRLVASSCNVASRWHCDGEASVEREEADVAGREEPNVAGREEANVAGREEATSLNDRKKTWKQGKPLSLLQKIGLSDLADKWPPACIPMGALVGGLTEEAASHLGLPAGLAVAQGGPDAYVGMVGLGAIRPGQLALITGSSHLHLCVSADPTSAPGVWGAYRGAPLPGLCFAEGGQSSTGSILRWARDLFNSGAAGTRKAVLAGEPAASGSTPDEVNSVSYKALDEEAADVPVGAEGLVALETFQGARTPVTDPRARGALVGLTLRHGRAHIWRALLEGVCLGTRAALEGLAQAGHAAGEIALAGGATRSEFWLQMHSDATGLPVVVCECTEAPLLGSACLAAVGAGLFPDVAAAADAMVRRAKRIEPREADARAYARLYDIYKKLAPAVKEISQSLGGL